MTWHLKDRELEKKLIAIDPDFVGNLQKSVKYHEGETTIAVGFGDGLGGLSRFVAEFRWGELEEVPEYNPRAWNDYQKVTPPEGVWMRVETTRKVGAKAMFKNGYWVEPDGHYFVTGGGRFRPWED